MSMSQAFLAEFDQEMASTRKVLERVPTDKLGWQPHEKSGTMGWMASHVAELPSWCTFTLQATEFDVAPAGREPYRTVMAKSAEELLSVFDQGVAEARPALAAATDESMMVPWTLKGGGQVFFTMPRVAVIRSFVFNHMIHHRGQLTMYLRAAGIPVPGMYGPSADEK